MDSNTHQGFQQNQPSSGLLRFRSAPSSLLSNLTPPSDSERLVNNRFVSYGSDCSSSNDTSVSPSFRDFVENKPFSTKGMNSQQQGYGGGGGCGLPPHYPRHGSAMDGSYGTTTHLLRQGSSPANLFSNNVSFQNGFVVGNYGALQGNNGQISPSVNRLKTQMSFPSRSASSLGMLSQISEIEDEDIRATSPDDGRQVDSNGHGFPYASWNDTPQLSENLNGLKRGRSGNEKMFSDLQNGELGSQVHTLSHHLSLPKTSAEIAAMEKLLQFPDSVPCKIRAKRGCATHPRSIAERVRRTRISERMRKLQELVPNMDKQTNTSDMLDLAVDYIKDLQKQFKTLSEKRAKCKCMSTQKAETNPIA